MTPTAKKNLSIAMIGCTAGWHRDELMRAAAKRGCLMNAFDYDDLSSDTKIRLGDRAIGDFDAVLTRTMPAASLDLVTLRLSMLHESAAETTIINSAAALERAIDKFRTASLAIASGLPTVPTYVAQDRSTALRHFDLLGGDVVVKPVFGGEGRGVMRIRHIELARTVFSTLQTAGVIMLQQPFMPPGGRDYRLLIVGDQTFAVERQNSDDFRTNRHAGSVATKAAVDPSVEDQSRRLMQRMELVIAAVDWIDTVDGRQLLEVNAIPGWKMAQSVHESSIAEAVLDVLR